MKQLKTENRNENNNSTGPGKAKWGLAAGALSAWAMIAMTSNAQPAGGQGGGPGDTDAELLIANDRGCFNIPLSVLRDFMLPREEEANVKSKIEDIERFGFVVDLPTESLELPESLTSTTAGVASNTCFVHLKKFSDVALENCRPGPGSNCTPSLGAEAEES